MKQMLSSLIGHLRIVGLIEGVSYIFLVFIAMPLKYSADIPMAVKISGMIHGILFVLFVGYLTLCHFKYRWSVVRSILLLVLSLIPFGNFIADHFILKPEAEAVLKGA